MRRTLAVMLATALAMPLTGFAQQSETQRIDLAAATSQKEPPATPAGGSPRGGLTGGQIAGIAILGGVLLALILDDDDGAAAAVTTTTTTTTTTP